ncbi:MAG: hypothetical protein PVH45_00240 [Candidatus Omnitrophota bacterium]
MKKHRFGQTVFRIIILAAFIANFSLADAWAVVDVPEMYPSRPGAAQAAEDLLRLDAETFTIPERMGTIRSFHKGTSDKIVIHIQDAHCNYDAQKKISEIIRYLNVNYGVANVNLEGGTKGYDLSVFTGIRDSGIRERVADYFVKEGLISGAEDYAVNNPGAVKLWGVENADLYIENLNVYRESDEYTGEAEQLLSSLGNLLNQFKLRIFSKELLDMDIKYAQYKAGNMDFKDYLDYILKNAKKEGMDIKKYPNVYLLNQSLEQEGKINFRKATNERDELVERLKGIISRSMLKELAFVTAEFKEKRISQYEFYEYILEKARMLDIDLDEYKELRKFIVYISLYNAVDKLAVMDELTAIEDSIKEHLYRNDAQRELNVLSKNLVLMKNMFEINMSKSDYDYYKKNSQTFGMRNYTSFIKKEAPAYKIKAEPIKNIARLDEYRKRIERFFEYSFDRDHAFLENLKFSSSGKPTADNLQSAILITGGFHTDNLCGLLKEKEISYISIMPTFKNPEGYESPYFEILSGKRSHFMSSLEDLLFSIQVPDLFNALGRRVEGDRAAELARIAVLARAQVEAVSEELRKWGFDGIAVQTTDDDKYLTLDLTDTGPVYRMHNAATVDAGKYFTVSRDVRLDVSDQNRILNAISALGRDFILQTRPHEYFKREGYGDSIIKKLETKLIGEIEDAEVRRDLTDELDYLLGTSRTLPGQVAAEKESLISTVDGLLSAKAGGQGITLPANRPEDESVRDLFHELLAGIYGDQHELYEQITTAINEGDKKRSRDLINRVKKNRFALAVWKVDDAVVRAGMPRDYARPVSMLQFQRTWALTDDDVVKMFMDNTINSPTGGEMVARPAGSRVPVGSRFFFALRGSIRETIFVFNRPMEWNRRIVSSEEAAEWTRSPVDIQMAYLERLLRIMSRLDQEMVNATTGQRINIIANRRVINEELANGLRMLYGRNPARYQEALNALTSHIVSRFGNVRAVGRIENFRPIVHPDLARGSNNLMSVIIDLTSGQLDLGVPIQETILARFLGQLEQNEKQLIAEALPSQKVRNQRNLLIQRQFIREGLEAFRMACAEPRWARHADEMLLHISEFERKRTKLESLALQARVERAQRGTRVPSDPFEMGLAVRANVEYYEATRQRLGAGFELNEVGNERWVIDELQSVLNQRAIELSTIDKRIEGVNQRKAVAQLLRDFPTRLRRLETARREFSNLLSDISQERSMNVLMSRFIAFMETYSIFWGYANDIQDDAVEYFEQLNAIPFGDGRTLYSETIAFGGLVRLLQADVSALQERIREYQRKVSRVARFEAPAPAPTQRGRMAPFEAPAPAQEPVSAVDEAARREAEALEQRIREQEAAAAAASAVPEAELVSEAEVLAPGEELPEVTDFEDEVRKEAEDLLERERRQAEAERAAAEAAAASAGAPSAPAQEAPTPTPDERAARMAEARAGLAAMLGPDFAAALKKRDDEAREEAKKPEAAVAVKAPALSPLTDEERNELNRRLDSAAQEVADEMLREGSGITSDSVEAYFTRLNNRAATTVGPLAMLQFNYRRKFRLFNEILNDRTKYDAVFDENIANEARKIYELIENVMKNNGLDLLAESPGTLVPHIGVVDLEIKIAERVIRDVLSKIVPVDSEGRMKVLDVPGAIKRFNEFSREKDEAAQTRLLGEIIMVRELRATLPGPPEEAFISFTEPGFTMEMTRLRDEARRAQMLASASIPRRGAGEPAGVPKPEVSRDHGQIIRGVEVAEVMDAITGDMNRRTVSEELGIIRGVFSDDNLRKNEDTLRALAARLGEDPGTMLARIKSAREDLLDEKKGKPLRQFPAIVRGPNEYALGIGMPEFVAYSSELLQTLPKSLKAEYLFHEALCYYFPGEDGHQTARRIQMVLFPQNYNNMTEEERARLDSRGDTDALTGRLTLALRGFIDSNVQVESATESMSDLVGNVVDWIITPTNEEVAASKFAVDKSAGRLFRRSYGSETIIRDYVYKSGYSDETISAKIRATLEKVREEMQDKKYKDKNPRAIMYTPGEARASGKSVYDLAVGILSEDQFGPVRDMIVVIKENGIPDSGFIDEVMHVVLGKDLLNYNRYENVLDDKAIERLSRFIDSLIDPSLSEQLASDPKGFIEGLMKGVIALRLRPIDYEGIRQWKESQDEILRSL